MRTLPVRPLLALSALALMSAACGASKDDASALVKAPVIPGSSNHGVLITATNVDQSIKSSRVYYYEFAAGTLREILSAESGDPAVFWADGRAFLFNRQPDQLNVRTFDPKTTSGKVTEPSRPLPDMSPGDPWDVVPLVAGSKALLAAPIGGKLLEFDYEQGTLADAGRDAPLETLRPVALLSSANKIHALQSGVKGLEAADGSQQILTATASAAGDLTFGASKPITASNPSGFLNDTGTTVNVVGLCAPSISGCVAGADQYNPGSGVLAALATFDAASVPYRFKNKVVSGPQPTGAYAHVETASAQYKVIRLDAKAKTTAEVHTFPDDRLYGIAFDPSSKTLLVGGHQEFDGELVLYRDDVPVGSVTLDGIPYNFAFVPN